MNKTEAQQDLMRRKDVPPPDGLYIHHKGGLYITKAVSLLEDLPKFLRDIGVDEELGAAVVAQVQNDSIPLVTYRSNARGSCWTRTLKDFQEHVTVPVLRAGRLQDGSENPALVDTVESVPRFRREGR